MSFYKKLEVYRKNINENIPSLSSKDKLVVQELWKKWCSFTNKIVIDNGLVPFKEGRKTDNGNWNNSGKVNSQLFNRYKPARDDSYLMIYFNLSGIREPYISIGVYVDKVPEEDVDKARGINRYLGDKLEGKKFKGFRRGRGSDDKRSFYIEDIERIKFDDVKFLMTHLIDVYNDAYFKFFESNGSLTEEEIEGENSKIYFLSSERKKEIEEKAVSYVIKKYEKDGYTIKDRQKDNCGYDLLATKASKRLELEVKGTSSKQPRFFISRNEYRYAEEKDNKNWRLVLIYDIDDKPKEMVMTVKEMEEVFDMDSLCWECIQK